MNATLLQNFDVFLDDGTSDASVDSNALVLADRVDDVGNLH